MRVLILGAGFGGLELSSTLSEELGEQIQVTLIDSSDHFIFGYSKLDVMFGRQSAESARCYYRDIIKPGVEFRQEEVISIDPETKHVVTSKNKYDTDVLVVALGSDYDVSATPGLAEAGYEFYSPAGAEKLHDIISGFDSGTVVVGVMGSIFKCPPAPCEAVFMLHDEFVRRGVENRTKIILVSSMSSPVPLSQEMSESILKSFKEKGIKFIGSADIRSVDKSANALILANGQKIDFDLLMAVPVHIAPSAVQKSKLATNGWIEVDPFTLETSFEDAYAIGDVTETKVPRAGVFSEGQAKVVASNIISKFRGKSATKKYDGSATCYVEFGEEKLAQIDVNFLGGPNATGKFTPPKEEAKAYKEQFGASRRKRWFNKG